MIGEYLASLNYKGILGIDFLITKDQKVYPVECNPRLTGALPMLSQLYISHGLIPMEVFHMLEFLDIPYEIDLDQINAGYEKGLRGSHVLLFGLSNDVRIRKDGPKAGLYGYDPLAGAIRYLEEAFDYSAMHNDRQFILIDGPPDTGKEDVVFKDPLYRLCRILFPVSVIDDKDRLSKEADFVIDQVYRRLVQ